MVNRPKMQQVQQKTFFFFFLRFDQLGLFVGEQMQQSWRLKEILNPNSSADQLGSTIFKLQVSR